MRIYFSQKNENYSIMREFDFHSCLSFDEFERFSRDILQASDGVDVINTSGNKKIIAQVKCYKKDAFSQLKASLKKELVKMKKENPDRYIIITSVNFSKRQYDKILKLFGGFLNRKDIIDANILNQLLLGSQKSKYQKVLLSYNKLWIAGTDILEIYLKKIIHRGEHNRGLDELEKIKMEAPFFVQTTDYLKALDFFQHNHVIIQINIKP